MVVCIDKDILEETNGFTFYNDWWRVKWGVYPRDRLSIGILSILLTHVSSKNIVYTSYFIVV